MPGEFSGQEIGSIESDLLDFFAARDGLFGDGDHARLDCRFLETGALTSLGLVELVMHVEQQYGVRFTADDLQADAFKTCRGLAALISERAARVA